MSSTSFQNAWTVTQPDGSEAANTIDDEFRRLCTNIQERLRPMLFGFNPNTNVAEENAYGIKHLRFRCGTSGLMMEPSVSALGGGTQGVFLFGTNMGMRVGLAAKVSGDGTAVYTLVNGEGIPGGQLVNYSVDHTKIRLGWESWLLGINAAGGTNIQLLRPGTNADGTHCVVLPQHARLSTPAAPTHDYDLSPKKYVDDAIAAQVPSVSGSNDSTGETAVGNLKLKWGKKTLTANSGSLTFTGEGLTAFPTACFQVIACAGKSSGGSLQTIQVYNITTTGFSWQTGSYSDVTPMRWFALGY